MLSSSQERTGDTQGGVWDARLRPQARFGAQPPKAALSVEMSAAHSAFPMPPSLVLSCAVTRKYV